MYERLCHPEHSDRVVELLTDDPFSVENARMITIMKTMSNEIVNADFQDAKPSTMHATMMQKLEAELGYCLEI